MKFNISLRSLRLVSLFIVCLVLLSLSLGVISAQDAPTGADNSQGALSYSYGGHQIESEDGLRAGSLRYKYWWRFWCTGSAGQYCNFSNTDLLIAQTFPAESTIGYVGATPTKGKCTVAAARIDCNLGNIFVGPYVYVYVVVGFGPTDIAFNELLSLDNTGQAASLWLLNPTSLGPDTVANDGFETEDGVNPVLPALWTIPNFDKGDGRVCNEGTTVVSLFDSCALKLKGQRGAKKGDKAEQVLTPSAANSDAGDYVWMGAYVRSKNAVKGTGIMILSLTYTDATAKKLKVKFPKGNSKYVLYFNALTLPKAVSTASLRIAHKGTSGVYFVDDVTVVFADADAALTMLSGALPLPQAAQ